MLVYYHDSDHTSLPPSLNCYKVLLHLLFANHLAQVLLYDLKVISVDCTSDSLYLLIYDYPSMILAVACQIHTSVYMYIQTCMSTIYEEYLTRN